MGKKNKTSKEQHKFEKYKLSYEMKVMDRSIREIDSKHYIRLVSKIVGLFFTVGFGFIALIKCSKGLPVSYEILFGIPSSSLCLIDVSNILNFFKRTPP